MISNRTCTYSFERGLVTLKSITIWGIHLALSVAPRCPVAPILVVIKSRDVKYFTLFGPCLTITGICRHRGVSQEL